MPLTSRKEITKFVHRKVLFRLRRLAVFFIVVTGILIYEISQNYIAGIMAFAGFIAGIALGLAVQRMHILSWDADTNKAVTKMDQLGIFILIAYLLVAIFRHWILGHWLHGNELTAFSISVGAGGILGRLFTLRQRIRQILKQEGVLQPRRKKTLD